jgi:parvulin-like peptidyl-prolyl isomerase
MPQPLTPLPAPAAVSPGATVVEYPIARVNDQIIDNSDYQREREELVQQAQQKKLSAADLEQLEKDQLRDMIDWQLLLSRGKELEINADAEVIRQLDEIRKEHNLDSMDALDKAVRDSGMSVEDFKQKIKEDVITQEVIRDEVARNLRLTAKEEQAYYEAHKQDFQSPEQVRLSEILIPTPNNATQAQIDQAQAKANDVLAKLKAGAKFEDLAKQYSGGPNADAGGDLGEFKRGQMAKVLEDQTFSLQPGESTAPIRTVQGAEGSRAPGRGNPAPERGGRAGAAGSVRSRHRAGAAGLSDRSAGEGVHRDCAGFCGYGRERQADQARVFRSHASAGEEGYAEGANECPARRVDDGACCGGQFQERGCTAQRDQRGDAADRFGSVCKDGGHGDGQEAEEDQAGKDPVRTDAAQRASGLARGDAEQCRGPGPGSAGQWGGDAGWGDDDARQPVDQPGCECRAGGAACSRAQEDPL